MPDVIAITPIDYGRDADGKPLRIKAGQKITVGKETELSADKAVFSEEQVRHYIAGGVAFDKSGELNDKLPPGYDEATLRRDAMLLEAGQLVHFDTSNSMDNAQKMIPQDNPASIERKAVVDEIIAAPTVETPDVIKPKQAPATKVQPSAPTSKS